MGILGVSTYFNQAYLVTHAFQNVAIGTPFIQNQCIKKGSQNGYKVMDIFLPKHQVIQITHARSTE